MLIDTSCSLVSLGTERMLIDFGKGGWVAKARSQPDKVKQVFQKIKTDGLWTTVDAVKAKLDTPIPLGYCNVGRVTEADAGSGYYVGDRVASNGAHAETVCVSKNLTAKIPDSVSNEAAAFTVVGSIGLQGIRLLQPTLGERIVVSGLGLIGLLAVQLLKANGCQVLGIDFDPKKLELARQFGAEVVDLSVGQDPVAVAEQWSDGTGVDGVLITASTKSDELIHQAATMCRQRGRIVLVGVIGLNLQRADFYEKELSFQVSCSYGPGRYDPNYESRGLDYPIGHVRWTEQRNFEAVLQLMADGKIDVEPLITHRVAFDNALDGYAAVSEPGAMGILLKYGEEDRGSGASPSQNVDVNRAWQGNTSTKNLSPDNRLPPLGRPARVAFVGAGGFTTRMLLPSLPTNVEKHTIVSGSGVTAAHAASKFGFKNTANDISVALDNPEIDAVFITTPHHLHARMVCDALNAGKHVFVEKPLAMTMEDMDQIEACLQDRPNVCLMVGFNRRFSPHTVQLKDWLRSAPSNKAVIITVNAGAIPSNHWTQDRQTGGGRIVGEACHFIDLARYLAGQPVTELSVVPIEGGDGQLGDCVSIQMKHADGSISSVHYLANGSKDFPKERIEVFAGGKVVQCDNFRVSREFGSRRKFKTSKQDKGHAAELRGFIEAIQNGGAWPIPKAELLEVSRLSIEAAKVV